MPSVSDRLAQEDKILRQIRSTLTAFRAMNSTTPTRRGVVYASAPITSGFLLYERAWHNSFTDTAEFRRAMPSTFAQEVFQPNLLNGKRFAEALRKLGWSHIIVPGEFFAAGWTQEHYMSLWRQVIVRHARTVALAKNWEFSLGCTEEFIIALQHDLKIVVNANNPLGVKNGVGMIRRAVDKIDTMGFNAKPHYELWRLATLTLEAAQPKPKTA